MRAFRHFKPYHWDWLVNHPMREPEWLARRLRDGFDVHHLDGNPKNNDQENLVLIDCEDHMRIHNGSPLSRLVLCRRGWEQEGAAFERGKKAYNMRTENPSWLWSAISERLGGKNHNAMAWASRYAREKGLPWPIPFPVENMHYMGRHYSRGG